MVRSPPPPHPAADYLAVWLLSALICSDTHRSEQTPIESILTLTLTLTDNPLTKPAMRRPHAACHALLPHARSLCRLTLHTTTRPPPQAFGVGPVSPSGHTYTALKVFVPLRITVALG